MKQLSIIILSLLAFGCSKKPEQPRVSSGSIVRLENFGSGGVTPRNVDIWLPDGYSEDQKYAVLYMHDGQMLFDAETTWNKQEWKVDEVVSALITDGSIRPCIVIGVWNAGEERYPDYFPGKPFDAIKTNFGDSLLATGREEYQGLNMETSSDKYLEFLVNELKPYIDNNYSVLTDTENTFVMGSSMGGLISMYALAEYPEVFGGAACLSTHWIGFWEENEIAPNAFGDYLSSRLPNMGSKKFYCDYGTETLDAKYGRAQQYIDRLVTADSTLNLEYMSKVFEGAAHDEVSWANRLDVPLKFLLAK